MNVLVLGSDGYLGRALSLYLISQGFKVSGIDNGSRQSRVKSVGSDSLVPVDKTPWTRHADVTDYHELKRIIEVERPQVIVHLAEQPSAPFSMLGPVTAGETMQNNIVGTLNVLWAIKEVDPMIHLIKLGTAGEYPDWLYDGITVPEGSRITVEYDGRHWSIPTPRYAGSWYHWSKVHDSMNLDYASRLWGLRITDLNQGVVYGYLPGTRFDYDSYFGTVVNRFAVQAVAGIPLTCYGTGGQMRGFIHIQNVLEAIELVINNPSKRYEFRVFHQLTETKRVRHIAEMVRDLVPGTKIQYIPNPRVEMSENTFTFQARELNDFGLKPISMDAALGGIIDVVGAHRDLIKPDVIMPETTWRNQTA